MRKNGNPRLSRLSPAFTALLIYLLLYYIQFSFALIALGQLFINQSLKSFQGPGCYQFFFLVKFIHKKPVIHTVLILLLHLKDHLSSVKPIRSVVKRTEGQLIRRRKKIPSIFRTRERGKYYWKIVFFKNNLFFYLFLYTYDSYCDVRV